MHVIHTVERRVDIHLHRGDQREHKEKLHQIVLQAEVVLNARAILQEGVRLFLASLLLLKVVMWAMAIRVIFIKIILDLLVDIDRIFVADRENFAIMQRNLSFLLLHVHLIQRFELLVKV